MQSRQLNKSDRMKLWNAGNGWSVNAYNGSTGTSSGDTLRWFTVNILGNYFHNDNPMQRCTPWCYRLLYGLLILLFLLWTTACGFLGHTFQIQKLLEWAKIVLAMTKQKLYWKSIYIFTMPSFQNLICTTS